MGCHRSGCFQSMHSLRRRCSLAPGRSEFSPSHSRCRPSVSGSSPPHCPGWLLLCPDLFAGWLKINWFVVGHQIKTRLSFAYLLNLFGSREWLCLFERWSMREVIVEYENKETTKKPKIAEYVPSKRYGNSWSSPHGAVIFLNPKRRFELLTKYFRRSKRRPNKRRLSEKWI